MAAINPYASPVVGARTRPLRIVLLLILLLTVLGIYVGIYVRASRQGGFERGTAWGYDRLVWYPRGVNPRYFWPLWQYDRMFWHPDEEWLG
jgi:hypothetical protein